MANILETLTDALSEAKAKADSPWLGVGGYFSRYDTSYISQIIPDLAVIPTDPTRGDTTLDYTSYSNFNHAGSRKGRILLPNRESENNKSSWEMVAHPVMQVIGEQALVDILVLT